MASTSLRGDTAWDAFVREHGPRWQVTWNPRTGTPHRIAGHYITVAERVTRANVASIASRFVHEHRELLRADPDRLVLARVDWQPGQQEGTGTAVVHFRQVHRGLRVVGGSVRVVFRGQRITTVGSDFHGGITIGVEPDVPRAEAGRIAARAVVGRPVEPVDVELVILPQVVAGRPDYRLAWQVTLPVQRLPASEVREDPFSRGRRRPPDGGRVLVQWRLQVDAQRGTVLDRTNLIRSQDLTGTVTGLVRPFTASDSPISAPIVQMTARADQAGLTLAADTDAGGQYRITGLAAGPAAVDAHLAGPAVRVLNDETPDPDASHAASLVVPAVHGWSWDADDPSPDDVETNVFHHVGSIRRWFLRGPPFDVAPLPPAGSSDPSTPAHVRIGQECNAWAGGGTLWFGSGIPAWPCPDFGLCAGVAYHEYTHLAIDAIYAVAPPPDPEQFDAMHEGFADYFAATVTGRSAPSGECNTRDLEPDMSYPVDFGFSVHLNGTIIGGALWDARQALGAALMDALAIRALKQVPGDFREYLGALLEEDDDPLLSSGPSANASPADGTPNADALCHAFFDLHGIYHDYCARHTQGPIAVIDSPSPLSDAPNLLDSGVSAIDIVGTAEGGRGAPLQSFAVEYANEASLGAWQGAGVTLTAGGGAPVARGVLARWDVLSLPDGYYLIRLTATDAGGNVAQAFTTVSIDRHLATGWPRRIGEYFISSPVAADLDPAYPGLEILARARWGALHAWHADGTAVAGWPRYVFHWPPTAPAVADLDRDGALEVIAAGQHEVSVLRRDGSPMPGWPQSCPSNTVDDMGPAVADLGGDGTLEIIVGTEQGHVCAWHADGSPVAGWPVALDKAVRLPAAVGDVDGDGAAEVAVATDTGDVYLLSGNGAIRAGWPQSVGGRPAAPPTLGDLDEDGHGEVAVGGPFQVFVWQRDGTTFSGWPQTAGRGIPDGTAVVLADLDANRAPEVLLKADAPMAELLIAWVGDGTMLPGFPTDFGCPYYCAGNFRSPAAGDVDGDDATEAVSLVDFWWVGGSQSEHELLGSRMIHKVFAVELDGTVTSGWPRYVPSDYAPSPPVLSDIDADGRVELIIGAMGALYVWDVPGGGRFLEWPTERFDNARSGHYRQPLPDLVVDSMSHTPPAPATSDVITFTVVVKNVGAGRARASALSFRVGGETKPATYIVQALSPGRTYVVERRESLGVAQAYQNTVTVDAVGDVPETDETNNVRTYTYVVGLPDLVIESHQLFPPSPTVSDEVTFTVIVRNAGTARASASTLSFRIGGETTPATYAVPALSPGQTHVVQRRETLDVAQAYQNTLIVDAGDVVAEANESNNLSQVTYSVGPSR